MAKNTKRTRTALIVDVPPEMRQSLKNLKEDTGVPVNVIIRKLISDHLAEQARRAEAEKRFWVAPKQDR